jgi:hypothetical protein
MRTLFLGSTKIPGASYLDTNAILRIKEGVRYGATAEYVDVGDFHVSSVRYNPQRQSLDIDAVSKIDRMSLMSSIEGRYYPGHRARRISFDTEGEMDGWRTLGRGTVSLGVTSGFDRGYVRATSETEVFVWSEYNKEMFDDFVYRVGMRRVDSTSIPTLHFSYTFNTQYPESGGGADGYEVQLKASSIDLFRRDKTFGATLLSSVGAGVSTNTYHFLTVLKQNADIQVYLETNPFSIYSATGGTLIFNVKDRSYGKGNVGFGVYNGTVDVTSVELYSLEPLYTSKDLLTKVLNAGDIWDFTFSDFVKGASGFSMRLGSCWVLGTTNGQQQADHVGRGLSAGLEMMSLSGVTSDTFVMDCEMRGISGNYGGMVTGMSGRWVGWLSSFSEDVNGSMTFRLLSDAFVGVTYYNFSTVRLVPDHWYRVRMVKDDDYLSWFVNNRFVGSVRGGTWTSYELSGVQTVGILGNRGATSGTRTSYRNVEISRFDDIRSGLLIEPNSSLKSAFDRVLPRDSIVEQSGLTFELFMSGDSRGSVGVSSNMSIGDVTDGSYSSENAVFVRGGLFSEIEKVGTTHFNFESRSDRVHIRHEWDGEISSNKEIRDKVSLLKSQLLMDSRRISVSGTFAPMVQRYDRMSIDDRRSGISFAGRVVQQTRSVDMGTGDVRHSLILGGF